MIPLILTVLAGLSTIIGGFIGVHRKILNDAYLSAALSFSAGAMLYISAVELIPDGISSLSSQYGSWGVVLSLAVFVLGLLVSRLIQRFVPASSEANDTKSIGTGRLLRSGMTLAVVMAIHNFPEGLVTYAGAMHSTSLGIVLAFAIALHNIPEGIVIAAPVYAATKNRRKALWYTLLSGMVEPLGAVVGYYALAALIPNMVLGVIFNFIAGMMIYMGAAELLPTARRYQRTVALLLYSFALGGVAMLVSKLLIGMFLR